MKSNGYRQAFTAAMALIVVGVVTIAAALDLADAPRGKAVYGQYCQACHGPKGQGDGWVMFYPPVTDLTADRVKSRTDKQLLTTIHQGRSNTAMGSWRLVLSDEERHDVLAYIRTLQKR
jgi:mono/diheme cytochrome c family protein